MSEFKVRAVDFEEKSAVEMEQELVERHEKELTGEPTGEVSTDEPKEVTEETVVKDETSEQAVPVTYEIKDEDVLSHIRNRYNKEINSIDDLFAQREANDDLPEDAAAFLRFKRETGRGIEDFVKLNRDYGSMDEKSLLAEYYSVTNPEFDKEDIAWKIDELSYDEDYDDEKTIKSKKLALKQELKRASDFFDKQKEQYRVPLESSRNSAPIVDEEYEHFKQYKQQSVQAEEETRKKSDYFVAKTNELFSEKFEGFEFNLDDSKVVYKPTDISTLKEQSDMAKFVKGFLNEDGYLKDAAAFHRAIAIASNPEKFAKFFYDKGKSDGVGSIAEESKNIDMGRPATTITPKQGFSVRALESEAPDYKIRGKK
jgi:hypothetical protein